MLKSMQIALLGATLLGAALGSPSLAETKSNALFMAQAA
jgi:multiple sugar transport system substrate-binding protein